MRKIRRKEFHRKLCCKFIASVSEVKKKSFFFPEDDKLVENKIRTGWETSKYINDINAHVNNGVNNALYSKHPFLQDPAVGGVFLSHRIYLTPLISCSIPQLPSSVCETALWQNIEP